MKNSKDPKAEIKAEKQPFRYVWATVIAIFGFLLYVNTIGNGYVLDDNFAIIKNFNVQEGISGIPKIFTVDFWYFANAKLGYYRPLSLVTFAIENEFFGNNPQVGHFDNALLYGFTGFMLFLFLLQLFPKKNVGFALLISIVFMAQPIHTEAVANIKSRDEILSFLNITVMLYFAFKYKAGPKPKYLAWSLVFFYLALLSKETAVVGIALLPVFLYYSGIQIPVVLKKLIPYGAVAIVFFLQKRYFLGDTVVTPNDIANYPYTSHLVKLPTAFHIFSLCLQRLLVPWPLTYDYSYNQVPASHWNDGGAWLGLLLFSGMAGLAIKGLYQKKIWGIGLSVVLITLAPGLGFVILRGGIMAERFLYAPCLGFAILLIYGLSLVAAKADSVKLSLANWVKNNIVMAGSIGLIAILYSFITVSRNNAWKDEFTLYSTDVKNSPNSCQVHLQLGTVLLDKGKRENDSLKRKEYFNNGISEILRSLAIHPDFEDAYFQLGFAYMIVEVNYDSSIKYYKRAAEIDPGIDLNYNNLGVIYQKQGKYELASYYYNKAAALNPQFSDGVKNAAFIKKNTGFDVRVFPGEDSKGGSPSNGNELKNLAIKEGQGKEFENFARKGSDFVAQKKFDSAIVYFKKAAAIQPKDDQNLLYLANCYGMTNRLKEAVKTFELILKHDPDKQIAIQNLARTYEALGEKEKADALKKRLK